MRDVTDRDSSTRQRSAFSLAVAWVALVCACRQPTRSDPLELALASEIGKQLGEALRVRCGFGMCVAKLGSAKALILMASEGEHLSWQIPGWFVHAEKVAASVTQAMAELDVPGKVDCGRGWSVLGEDDAVWCSLGDRGQARVSVDRGAIDIELILGAAAASARRGGPAVEELEMRSRALDPGAGAAVLDDADEPTDGGRVDSAAGEVGSQ